MEISVCKGVLVRSQDDCTTQLCIKVDRDLGGALLEKGGSILSSSSLFISTATNNPAVAPSSSSSTGNKKKVGSKRDRAGGPTTLPEGERFVIPVDVSQYAVSSSSVGRSSLETHPDLSLCAAPSTFSRVSLLKEALSTILDPTTRKKLSVNAAVTSTAGSQSTQSKGKETTGRDEGSSSTPLSSLDFSSSDLDDEDLDSE